jgi:DNA replication protein DnaC
MALVNPITDKLTSLRLHGMLQAYKEQFSESKMLELSFDDRLSILVDRENLHRENSSLDRRLSKAKFKNTAELSNVNTSTARGLDKMQLAQLGASDWIKLKRNIVITGPSGVGKTFLASAIAKKACLNGFGSRYYRASSVSAELEASREEGKMNRYIQSLNKFDVLITNDFCLSGLSEIEEKNLFELIEERHEKKSTIFTSQNPVSAWHGLMPNPAIADAILDRIAHGSIRLELKGESLRKHKPQALD